MQKSSVNKVILVGHIGNKPEGRYTPSGTSTATFSLATNESWIDSEKEKKEHTEWHNIVAWNKLADFTTEYLQKGQLIYIEGKQLVEVRGTGVYSHLKELTQLDFIEHQTVGRYKIFTTTEKFRKYFGIQGDDDTLRQKLFKKVRTRNTTPSTVNYN